MRCQSHKEKIPLPAVLINFITSCTSTKTNTETHLSCSEFPVRRQAVRCVHEDFGNTPSFLDGLQLEPEQVAVDAVSFKSLNRAGQKKQEFNIHEVETDKKQFSLIWCVYLISQS